MFFAASKLFWLVAQPSSVILLLVLTGLILVAFKRRRLAMVALAGGVGLHFLIAFTSLGYVIIQPLENRFAIPETPPQEVRGIIVLGGVTMARPSTVRGVAELNQAGDRLTTALMLAQRYPEARIILSGGEGLLLGETESEADTMRRFLVNLGVSEERLVLEGASRNTAENASFTRETLREWEGSLVLVTSAYHMARSVGLYRQEGIAVIPWPTDYRSAGNQGFGIDIANPNQNLETATVAIREWIGLVAYHWTGRTPDLLPAP